jgi:DNA-binding PadR family transcriptional regulator
MLGEGKRAMSATFEPGGPWWGSGPGSGPRSGPGFRFGPGWGPGWGFGADFGAGFGGRRGGRGRLRASVLALLAEQPRHGYEIILELAERSGGLWKPSPGSVYPLLQQLQDEGLVSSREEDGRRVYSLTEQGRRWVEENKEAGEAPWQAHGPKVPEGMLALLDGFRQLAATGWQVAQNGSPAQLAEARAVLDEARRSLYALLAGEETPGEH